MSGSAIPAGQQVVGALAMQQKMNDVLRTVRNRATAFQRDKRGSIAIVFALSLIVLVGFAGTAVDYGTAYRSRDMFQSAADAASLSVVSVDSPSYQYAATLLADGPVPTAEAAARVAFNTELAGLNQSMLVPMVTSTVLKTGAKLTSTVTFSVNVPTHFLGLFGVQTINVSGRSSSVNLLPVFLDFYLLLDNSPSMGVAATQADIDTMVASTPDQCAFACHDLSGTADYYTLAHNLGVTTRIDVLRQATQKLMDTAVATATVARQFQMSIDTFNMTTQSISPLTSNLATAKADANAIDLMSVPSQGWNNDRDTDFEVALNDTTAKVGTSGTGVTWANRQKVVFYVTDGVSDQVLSTAGTIVAGASSQPGGDRLIQATDPDQCGAMKARGIKIAVIYTTYLPLPTNAFYNSYVAAWRDEINPKLQACATPGYFFEVGPNQGIDTAMKALFPKAVAEARISS